MRDSPKKGWIWCYTCLIKSQLASPGASCETPSTEGEAPTLAMVWDLALHSHRDSGVPTAGPKVWQERGCPAQHISDTGRSFKPGW